MKSLIGTLAKIQVEKKHQERKDKREEFYNKVEGVNRKIRMAAHKFNK